MKLKEMPKFDRPREKMERYGVGRLEDEELLALLLGSGFKGLNVVELAKRIGHLIREVKFENLSLESLTNIKGLGQAKAGQILAAIEYGRRIHVKEPEFLLDPQKVFELCNDFRGSKREQFIVFYLSSRNSVIAREVVSIGTLDASLVHPREVFEPALKYAAAAVLVVHNHPSGDPSPSDEDLETTRKLQAAAKVLGLAFLDHVIVTKSNFLSFKERKVLFF